MVRRESVGVVGPAPDKRSLVVRVTSSEARPGLAGGVAASGASGLAGCVGGNGASGVVAHPASTVAIAKKEKIRDMGIDFKVFVSMRTESMPR